MASRYKRIKLWMLSVLFFTLIGMGGIAALMRPKIEPDQVFNASFGDVIWNHELHARMQEIANCQVCHHKESQGVIQPKPCESCHKPLTNERALIPTVAAAQPEDQAALASPSPPPPMTSYHAKCIGCHRAMQKGPMICRDCHAQTFHGSSGVVRWNHRVHARKIDMGTGPDPKEACLRCHHEDGGAATEADYQACRVCHKPAVVLGLDFSTQLDFHRERKHTECKLCHVQINPAESLRTCKDCHPGLNVDSKTITPPIEQALHAECFTCHNTENTNLTPGAPTRCDDCHKPDPSVIADLGIGILFWDHDRHTEFDGGVRCDTCHHTEHPESPHVACGKCHGSGLYENPTLVEALRSLCIGCHQEKQNGLISWNHLLQDWDVVKMFKVEAPEGVFYWNHREHTISWSFSCRNCHHPLLQKGNRSKNLTEPGRDWSDGDTHPASCRTCHGSSRAVESRHSKRAGDANTPAYIYVLKIVCLECHNSLGGGPQAWSDFF